MKGGEGDHKLVKCSVANCAISAESVDGGRDVLLDV